MLVEVYDDAGVMSDAEAGDEKSKSKIGLIVGIGAAAVLAGTAAFVSLGKKPEEGEANESEKPEEDFDNGEIKSEESKEETEEETKEEAEEKSEEKTE